MIFTNINRFKPFPCPKCGYDTDDFYIEKEPKRYKCHVVCLNIECSYYFTLYRPRKNAKEMHELQDCAS